MTTRRARNLTERTLRVDPNAKALVHAGFAHVQKRPTESWFPTAWYVRQITGFDPVTVDQTVMANLRAVGRSLIVALLPGRELLVQDPQKSLAIE